MSASPEAVLLSLKPCYADMVFAGEKRAELRRRAPVHSEGGVVFVYVTRPVMHLRGQFRVRSVRKGTPDEVWDAVSEEACVERLDFDAYYAGRDVAYALEITDVREYDEPVTLDELRRMFGSFVVPQSWRYAKAEERERFLEHQERDRSRSSPPERAAAV